MALGLQASEDGLFQTVLQLLFHLLQFAVAVFLARNDIELRGRRSTFGIHLVARAGSTESTAFVEMLGIDELGGDGIAQITGTQLFVHRRVLGSYITTLHHEFADDAVEQ